MWMIDDQQLNDRPLMTTIPTSCFHNNPNILLPWTHSISGGGASDYGVKNSTRWNPTPEQLQALEEMYRRGTRTPSAEQIQRIAAKLRRFGNIQGKNVFYWFQNHKARERHKIRRQLPPERPKQTGLSGRYFEIEHQIKLPTPSNCCSPPSEASVSMHRAVVAEYKKDERTGLDQKKNETSCWRLDLSSCLPPNNSVQTFTSGQENSKPYGYGALNLSILLPSKNDDNLETLQLFPVKSNDLSSFDKKEDILGVSRSGTKFTPNEFIEFL